MKKLLMALCSLTFVFGILFCSCTNNKSNSEDYDIKDYVIEVPYKENFQILQLSDTHWKGNTNWSAGEAFLQKVVNNPNIPGEKPDFIVITGDCVNYGRYEDWDNYLDFFDSFQIPWTLTFGNHDARAFVNLDDLTTKLNERSKNPNSFFKFVNNINDQIYGDANFAINLKDGNTIKEQLIIFDSNRYQNDYGDVQNIGDDCIHPDQVKWYRNLISWTTQQNNGKTVPSLAFFHIPLQEYLYAYETVVNGQAKYLDEGRLDEKICCSNRNAGLFDAMLELGSTKGVFCGHDHVNNFCVDYKGIKLAYGLKSSKDNYYNEGWTGGRLITLKSDGDFDTKFIKEDYAYKGEDNV